MLFCFVICVLCCSTIIISDLIDLKWNFHSVSHCLPPIWIDIFVSLRNISEQLKIHSSHTLYSVLLTANTHWNIPFNSWIIHIECDLLLNLLLFNYVHFAWTNRKVSSLIILYADSMEFICFISKIISKIWYSVELKI